MKCPKCGSEIEDGLTVCSKCNESLKKGKTYWLTKLSGFCLLTIAIFIFIAMISDDWIYAVVVNFMMSFGVIIAMLIMAFLFILIIVLPILAICYLLRINAKNPSSTKITYAFVIIAVSTLALFLMTPITVSHNYRGIAPRMICGTHLHSLGKAILVYAADNNDQLPDPNKWCDLLIANTNVPPEHFICKSSGAKLGESSYALNKEVIGMKVSEIPPDMVVLFETTSGITELLRDYPLKNRPFYSELNYYYGTIKKVYQDRWNQVAGPESLALDNHHGEGCNFLFGDIHAKFVKGLSDLKWSVKENFVFTLPQPLPQKIKLKLIFVNFRTF